jgi:uncharacterized membrane protein/mono/diheme cytochrome c family protein
MFSHVCRAWLAGLLLILSARGAEVASREEQMKIAQQVHVIFDAKCVECHGPELPRPKGKFGYVLDLKRVGENEEWVVKGNAEESELYKMVRDNDMPGEDASVPALTPDELAVVKRWIEIGAPGELPGKGEPEPAPSVAILEKPPEPFPVRVLRWIGQFHPLSTHFPVALMFVAVLAEGLAWASRRDSWLQTVRFLIVIAALGAVAATVLGWVNAHFSSYNKTPYELLWWHRWLGTGAGLWAAVCAVAAFMGECHEGSAERTRFRVALFVGATLVGIAGFLGSALIYGLDHYAWK